MESGFNEGRPLSDDQEYWLRFLKSDHGEYALESPLPENPLGQELGVEQGDVIATFKEHRFILWFSGGVTPIPRSTKP